MRPTDEQLYGKAEVAAAKKKMSRLSAPGVSAGGVPIDITPPSGPNWSDAFTGGSGGAPAPVANMAAPENADAVRQRVELQRRRQQLASEQGMIVQTPSTGLDLESKMARAAAIRERGNSIADINTSLAPVQKVQDPSQIIAARDDLRRQGVAQSILMQKRALDNKDAAAYGDASKAQAQFETSQNFAPIDPAYAAAIAQKQRELQAKQQVSQQVAAGSAGEDLARSQADIATRRAIQEKTGQLGVAQLDTALAENSPEAVARRQKLEEIRASTEANRTRREGGLSAAGIESPDAYQGFMAKGSSAITKSDPQAFAPALSQLDQISQVDPAEAQRIASNWIAEIDAAAPSGSMALVPFGGGIINSVQVARHAGRVKIRKALERYVQQQLAAG